jgi:hypothetical protein
MSVEKTAETEYIQEKKKVFPLGLRKLSLIRCGDTATVPDSVDMQLKVATNHTETDFILYLNLRDITCQKRGKT